MEEQLVSFEVAKLLKEISFNIPTLYCYTESKELQFSSGNEDDFDEYNHNLWFNYSAPTQSLAQKFLREKYNLNINIKHKPTSQTYGYLITSKYDKDNDYIVNKVYHKFETYELALSDALLTCLSKDENGKFIYIKLEK